jgi:hypothetical protein
LPQRLQRTLDPADARGEIVRDEQRLRNVHAADNG